MWPVVFRDKLKDSEYCLAKVFERGDVVLNLWVVVDAIILQANSIISRVTTSQIMRANELTITGLWADSIIKWTLGPVGWVNWFWGESAFIIENSLKLLQPKDAKNYHNEAQEYGGISKFRQRLNKSAHKSAHGWNGFDTLEGSEHSEYPQGFQIHTPCNQVQDSISRLKLLFLTQKLRL